MPPPALPPVGRVVGSAPVTDITRVGNDTPAVAPSESVDDASVAPSGPRTEDVPDTSPVVLTGFFTWLNTVGDKQVGALARAFHLIMQLAGCVIPSFPHAECSVHAKFPFGHLPHGNDGRQPTVPPPFFLTVLSPFCRATHEITMAHQTWGVMGTKIVHSPVVIQGHQKATVVRYNHGLCCAHLQDPKTMLAYTGGAGDANIAGWGGHRGIGQGAPSGGSFSPVFRQNPAVQAHKLNQAIGS